MDDRREGVVQDHLIAVVGIAGVVLFALYLLTLGGGAIIYPETTKRFLGGFATSQRTHFTELALRVVAGASLVSSAPRMAFGQGIALFGWMLVVTSLALAMIPWRLHHRFAAWAVPQATQHMTLVGIVSIVGGLAVLAALLLPRIAG
ncbi:MAG: hypothetical protein IPP98_15540 [Gemmatimonadetes bacterium]|nr:hypothetical protein [Gemmatimonadota bacterium]